MRAMAQAADDMTADPRWAAVRERDSSADGTFFCAVVTTGVYCRPSCPSRLPLRKNVRFFATLAEAERAGFRPCKRCKPDRADPDAAHAAVIAEACEQLGDEDGAPDFKRIAAAAGMSRHHFHRVFKSVTGMTPGAYRRSVREQRALGELQDGATVTQAIYGAGYGSSSRFYEGLAPRLGLKPKAFAKRGEGEVIKFSVGECSLGSILVAATEKGICAIAFGDDQQKLLEGLQDRFAKAELIGGDKDFEETVAKVVGFVEAPYRGLAFPLDIRGTAFQQKVWQALRDIPPGRTTNYAEIAKAIGLPKAVRAVANACANNALAVAIPCHRVIRTDGSLSGYRWGVERKKALLEKETPE